MYTDKLSPKLNKVDSVSNRQN